MCVVALAAGTAAALLILFLSLNHIGKTAIAACLLIGLAVMAIRRWFAVALASAIAAGLFVVYFVLPPFDSDLSGPQHWAALTTFLLTAVATSQLSIWVWKKEREAVERIIQEMVKDPQSRLS